MSLNGINLNNQMLADLYANVLVQTTPSNTASVTTSTPVPEPQPLKFLGKNTRHIVLLVHNQEVPFLTDGELNFLTNILSACKLSLADVAIVNIKGWQPTEVLDRLAPLEPQSILMFGLAPTDVDLPVNFPPFRLQPFGGRTYLHAPTLEELEKEKALKMNLWNALKTLFNI